MKVLTVIGARPQFIKAAPVSRALAALGIEEIVLHTGQHYDYGMSQIFFEELGMAPPAIDLEAGSGSHAEQTSKMLLGIEKALRAHAPDWTLVYGDTNSTLAGALAAVKLHLPVAHVEAGLRSFNRRMPEEINRLVADSVADVLFTPTRQARENLLHEGVAEGRIRDVGDVMFDAVLQHGKSAAARSTLLRDFELEPGGYVLATVHRAENTDEPDRLRSIIEGLSAVAAHVPVVVPLHPRTRRALDEMGLAAKNGALRTVSPVGYLDMIELERNASVIATDSGGVQKEAFFMRVPCVTLRDETEWTELVELGWNRLCPPTGASAVSAAIMAAIGSRGADASPYGAGDAAERIAAELAGAHHISSRVSG
jgi:UDP-GlcNAc3NAcA epimerase